MKAESDEWGDENPFEGPISSSTGSRRGMHMSSSIPMQQKAADANSVKSSSVSPLLCTVLWITLGISMIMFNKMILAPCSQGGWNFSYPFFLTMCHQLFATVATFLLERYTPLLESVKQNKLTRSAYWNKVVPLALFFSLGLVLGNSAYRYLSVSYIQMIKSTLPIPTLLVAFLLGREKPTRLQVGIVVLICTGAVIASLGELRFSLIGLALQGSALCADVFRMLFLDLLTIEVKLDNLSTLYYMAPLACVFICVGFFCFEYSTFHPFEYESDLPIAAAATGMTTSDQGISSSGAVRTVPYPSYFPLVLLANACLAFALNLSIVLFVSNAGIMAMTLAGIFKDVLVVVLSVYVFGKHSQVSGLQALGYGLSLAGLIVYKESQKWPRGGGGTFDSQACCEQGQGRGRGSRCRTIWRTGRALCNWCCGLGLGLGLGLSDGDTATVSGGAAQAAAGKIALSSFDHDYSHVSMEDAAAADARLRQHGDGEVEEFSLADDDDDDGDDDDSRVSPRR